MVGGMAIVAVTGVAAVGQLLSHFSSAMCRAKERKWEGSLLYFVCE